MFASPLSIDLAATANAQNVGCVLCRKMRYPYKTKFRVDEGRSFDREKCIPAINYNVRRGFQRNHQTCVSGSDDSDDGMRPRLN